MRVCWSALSVRFVSAILLEWFACTSSLVSVYSSRIFYCKDLVVHVLKMSELRFRVGVRNCISVGFGPIHSQCWVR